VVATSKGNGSDPRLELNLELQRYEALAPGERLAAVASSPRAKQLVRAIPAQLLFRDLAEAGLAHWTKIVRLASPKQFRVFVDLAGWKKDRIDLPEVVRWLRAARGSDREEFLAKVHGLDTELLEHILSTSTRVHSLSEEPDVHLRGDALETPDGKYLVEFSVEGIELSAIRGLLVDLVSEDPFGASRLLEALRWELPSELEEASYRFRMGRLEDLGFPSLNQAVSIFAYLDPDSARRFPLVESARSELARGEPVDRWSRALQGLGPGQRQRLDEELRYLVNCALVAEGAEPGDMEAIRRVTQMVRNTLGLGLEFLGASLGEVSAKYVFQIGFSLALRLKFRADRLAREPLAMIRGEYLVFPDQRATLVALRRKRPGREASDENSPAEPFRSLAEIAEAEASLARAEQQVAIFAALLGSDRGAAETQLERFGAPLSVVGPEMIFRALVANAILFGEARLVPFPRAQVGELWQRLFTDSNVAERALSTLKSLVPKSAVPELERAVARSIEVFSEEWGEAFRGGTDPAAQTVSAVLPLSS
jgi:hypothetical protein